MLHHVEPGPLDPPPLYPNSYLAAVSIHAQPGARPGDLWALPRLIIAPGESRFERRLKVSGFYPLWSRLPRLGVLAGLRGARP
jgi:hypothetical protein